MNCKVVLAREGYEPRQFENLDMAWAAFDNAVEAQTVDSVRLLDVALGSTHKVLREWKRTH